MEPMGLMIGGILALAMGVALFHDSDEDDQAPEPTLDDEGRLIGTDRDDDIDYSDESLPDYPREIFAGAGHDTVRAVSTSVNGEDGDDEIEVNNSYHDIIDGGAGDDLIDVHISGGSDIYGGAGNDTITVSDRVTDEPAYLDAGGGDDVIHYTHSFSVGGFSGPDDPTLALGDGADTLNMEISRGLAWIDSSAIVATIDDFDGAADVLNISMTDGSFTDYQIEETEDGTLVLLNYLQEEDGAEPVAITARLELPGVFGVPASAITVTNTLAG